MREIAKGIWTWSWFSKEKGYPFNGTLIQHGACRVIIDPVWMNEDDRKWIKRLAPFEGIFLTNKDHERIAYDLRRELKIPIFIHKDDVSFLKEKPDQTFHDGDRLPGGLEVIHLSDQKSPGESAFYSASRKVLILGDALIGHPPGSVRLLPSAKYADIRKAVEGLKRLADYSFDLLLLGDGEPILDQPKKPLRDFLNTAIVITTLENPIVSSSSLPHEEFFTTKELMQFLKIKNRQSIYQLIGGGMPVIKIGRNYRFSKDEIMQFLKKKRRLISL